MNYSKKTGIEFGGKRYPLLISKTANGEFLGSIGGAMPGYVVAVGKLGNVVGKTEDEVIEKAKKLIKKRVTHRKETNLVEEGLK